jgi:hypothetical protein
LPCAAEIIAPALGDRAKGLPQRVGGQGEAASQALSTVGHDPRALLFGLFEILALPRDPGNECVENRPSKAPGLALHRAGSLGIALAFVPEPLALGIYLKAALADRGPGDLDTMRMGNISVALISPQMPRRRAQGPAPVDRFTAVAVMAESDRLGDLWHVLRDHLRIAAKPVAGQHEPAAADGFGTIVGQAQLRAFHEVVLDKKAGGPAVADQANVARLNPAAQRVDQLVIGMVGGLITPPEAAAFGALGVLILAVLFRCLTWQAIKRSVIGPLRVTLMAYLIVFGSATFSQLVAFSGASSGLIRWATAFDLAPIATLLVMFGVLLLLGMFME